MLRIGTSTKKAPSEVIEKAIEFFGPSGYKLIAREQRDDYVMFEGGGGGIEISTCTEGDSTTVDMVSREWDYQVKEFIAKIK